VVPRRPALLSPAAFGRHAALVDAVFEASGRTVAARLHAVVGRARGARAVDAAALDGQARPGDLRAEDWARLTRAAGGVSPRRARRARR
jgi:hypothetical protein